VALPGMTLPLRDDGAEHRVVVLLATPDDFSTDIRLVRNWTDAALTGAVIRERLKAPSRCVRTRTDPSLARV